MAEERPFFDNDDWCDYSGHIPAKKDGKRPHHIRCPKCRRRLIPKTMNAEPFGNFQAYYVIPAHKKPHSKRPSRKRKKDG